MKREHHDGGGGGGYRMGSLPPNMAAPGKSKMAMEEEYQKQQQDAGVDELLAALGYKVRSSDMADVAQKLEQLEMAMGSGAIPDENAVLSHLASETVHYNPSDLSSWVESMLSELNAPPLPPPNQPASSSSGYLDPLPPPHPQLLLGDPLADSSTITTADYPAAHGDYEDLKAIPGGQVVYSDSPREMKRMKPSVRPAEVIVPTPPAPPVPADQPIPVVLVDSQDTGIRLVHTLLACAEAVQQDNLKAAEALVKQIGVLAMSQGGAMRKVATYFAEALARRIFRIYPSQDYSLDSAFSDILQMHFYESCPYLKFAHFTANQAILEAFAGKSRVHVIDFSMKQGMQWPALMQALALRPGGPPVFRLTGIGPPQPDNTDALQQVGWKLAQIAEAIHVEFEYRGFVANSLADLEPYMLDIARSSSSSSAAAANSGKVPEEEEEEAVAVNSVFELHRLLAQPGAFEKVLGTVKAVRPNIVTVVEQEANHNGPVFVDRFTEALHYYSTMFDSLEGCGGDGGAGAVAPPATGQDQVMSEVYLGRQICNVVACEGVERTERHESMGQWRTRFNDSGFESVHLGSNAFKQASMLLALFAGGDGYRVEEKEGCLMLGWHTRPLITTSAWRVGDHIPSL